MTGTTDSTGTDDSERASNRLDMAPLLADECESETRKSNPEGARRRQVSIPRLAGLWWSLLVILIGTAIVEYAITGSAATAVGLCTLNVGLVLTAVLVSNGLTELSSLEASPSKLVAVIGSSCVITVIFAVRCAISLVLYEASGWEVAIAILCHVAIVVLLGVRAVGRTGSGCKAFAHVDLLSVHRSVRLSGHQSSRSRGLRHTAWSLVVLCTAPLVSVCLVWLVIAAPWVDQGSGHSDVATLDPWLWGLTGVVLCATALLAHGSDSGMGTLAFAPALGLTVLTVVTTWNQPLSPGWLCWPIVFFALALLLGIALIAALPAEYVAEGPLRQFCQFLQGPAFALMQWAVAGRRKRYAAVLNYPNDTPRDDTHGSEATAARVGTSGPTPRRRPRH